MRLLVVIAALAACKDKGQPKGLPPAQEWNAKTGDMQPPAQPQQQQGHETEESSETEEDNGSAGSEGAPAAPDPDREIDPSHRIKGVIKLRGKAKDHAKQGGALFVIAKQAGPDGAPAGPPLAVEKLTWRGEQIAFELTEANAMIAGTSLTGDVIVTVHYDQDGDALTKQPGDILGTLRVKVPADGATIYLDDVVP